MAIELVERIDKASSSASNLYFYPTSIQAGDLIVITLISRVASTRVPQEEGGEYTFTEAVYNSTGSHKYLWYKVADGTENDGWIRSFQDPSQYGYGMMLVYRGDFNYDNLVGSISNVSYTTLNTDIKIASLDYNPGDLIVMFDSYITNREATANQVTPFVFNELLDVYVVTRFYGSMHSFYYVIPEDTEAGSTGDFFINLTCSNATSAKGGVAVVFTKALPPAQIINKSFFLS